MQRVLVVAIISVATAANGQIGESKAELSHRYGPVIPWPRMLTAEYGDLVDDACRFEHNGLKILVSFQRGKAALLMYQKLDKTSMSKEEVFSVLARAVDKPDWVLISGDSPNPCWRTGDSSVFAYYIPEPEFDGAPARLVRVQTAQLDRIYRKIRGEKPYRPNQALERTADRCENLLSMTSTLKSEAQRALVSGRSAWSR
jgi:hypothetical protein